MDNKLTWKLQYLWDGRWPCELTIENGDSKTLFSRAQDAIQWLESQGAEPLVNGSAPSPSPAPPAAGSAPPPPPGAAGVVATAEPETGTALCHKIEVKQSAGNRPQLVFWTGDGQLRCTLPAQAMLRILPSGWTADHLVPGGTFQGNWKVSWKQAGEYRNVIKVETA